MNKKLQNIETKLKRRIQQNNPVSTSGIDLDPAANSWVTAEEMIEVLAAVSEMYEALEDRMTAQRSL